MYLGDIKPIPIDNIKMLTSTKRIIEIVFIVCSCIVALFVAHRNSGIALIIVDPIPYVTKYLKMIRMSTKKSTIMRILYAT